MKRLIDLTGQKFGKWLVIRRLHKENSWLCLCVCGKEGNIMSWALRKKQSTSCGCSRKEKSGTLLSPCIRDLTGQTIGNFTIIKLDGLDKNHHARWICQCKCGNKKRLSGQEIRRNKSCGCLRWKFGKLNPNYSGIAYLNKIRFGAKARNIIFNISQEDIKKQFAQQKGRCALTNLPLKVYESQHIETSASLDRIDSSKGYVKGNIQWVHKIINKMKLDHPESEFIRYCRLVAENHPLPNSLAPTEVANWYSENKSSAPLPLLSQSSHKA